MAYLGGFIKSVKYDGTGGSFSFEVKANEDDTFDLGGLRRADDKTMITGNGVAIHSMTMNQWRAKCTFAWDMNIQLDKQKVITALSDTEEGTFTIYHSNGSVYKGKGSFLGEYEGNTNKATFPVIMGGSFMLKK